MHSSILLLPNQPDVGKASELIDVWSPEVCQQLCLCEVLHLISVDVVDQSSAVAISLQAAVDMMHEVHLVKSARHGTDEHAQVALLRP